MLNSEFLHLKLPQTLGVDVVLQPGNHFAAGFDAFSEGEIIPLSGVTKSGAGCIIHAGGTGGTPLTGGGNASN